MIAMDGRPARRGFLLGFKGRCGLALAVRGKAALPLHGRPLARSKVRFDIRQIETVGSKFASHRRSACSLDSNYTGLARACQI
jgi:hypothetical protein